MFLAGINVVKLKNGNRECVVESTTQPKSRKQPKATKGYSIQRENPALKRYTNKYKFSDNRRLTKFRNI